ncbi:integrase [Shewanella baltica]|uniref:Putative integrase protein n=1 Tax=Shewanella baltica (strain OS195) TaxID=399599 RepID=A9L057_SHEB9|nr:putative integrase protein [Shewanella baltica OS195]ADT92812.1 Integrase catalytic region [Shewanella baltica OS678]EHC04019.1 Integrase catalytic region [Shewanella baltica OS625]KZK67018.1 integrase [Shewanella baltica]
MYGEDAESALRFLFNAMAPKTRSDFPFQGRPKMLYLDNGPVAKSHVFQNVMQSLKVDWLTHTPAGKDGTRTTARSKGKVERLFRTVKEAHETLYHFHKPETELQAKEWLWNYLSRYNALRHRSEKHSRLEDWLENIPRDGVRDMCSWEQYCRFAREPESRKVGVDARVTIDGTAWEVKPDMAGETVILLWGLFDEEMYVEFTGETWGPYYPVSGPVPLHRYRTFRRGKAAERAARIHALARQLNIPISALSGSDLRVVSDDTQQRIDELPHQPFDARKFEYHFPGVIAAKLAIADDLAIPLARMSDEDRAFIDRILAETLNRSEVLARIRDYFRNRQSGEDHAG